MPQCCGIIIPRTISWPPQPGALALIFIPTLVCLYYIATAIPAPVQELLFFFLLCVRVTEGFCYLPSSFFSLRQGLTNLLRLD